MISSVVSNNLRNSKGIVAGGVDTIVNDSIESRATINRNKKSDVVGNRGIEEIVTLDTFSGSTHWSTEFTVNSGWNSFDTYPRLVGDVNGDGKADIIGFSGSSAYTVVSLSTGSSFASSTTWSTEFSGTTGWTSFDTYPRLVGDVNGDGKVDIIGFSGSSAHTVVSLSTGSSFASSTTWSTEFSGTTGWTSFDTYPRLVGDVNGDGKADIIGFSGSSAYTVVSLSTGSSFASSTTWSTEFSGTTGWTSFDTYPRLVGDVNGDGKADIVGFGSTATVVALSTGTSFTSYTTWSTEFTVNSGWNSFDYYPRWIGDVNGDGKADIVGFASSYTVVALSTGTSFASFTHWSTEFTVNSGWTSFDIYPRLVNDANGDGNADIVGFGSSYTVVALSTSPTPLPTSFPTIAPTEYPSSEPTLFESTVIKLSDLTPSQGFKINGAVGNDHSGFSVGDAGDVNNDGYKDIIIGAKLADPYGRGDAGTAYVIFGKANGFSDIDLSNDLTTTNQGFAINGISPGEQCGWSVKGAGDVNGDGYGDLIIGANLADPQSITDKGITYIVFGKANNFTNIDLAYLNSELGFYVEGANKDDQSGISVSGLGDINSDGYDDFIIGAHLADDNGRVSSGTSYVIFGKHEFTNFALTQDLASTGLGFAIYGAATGDQSGFQVSGAGDINKDGYDDILIGAPYADADANRVDAGISYLLFGGSSFTNVDLTNFVGVGNGGFTMYGANSNDYSGFRLSGAKDINNDGYADIIIGAWGVNSKTGRSYLIFGKATSFDNIDLATDLTASNQGFIIDGTATDGHSGASVSWAGDVNNDGFDDVIIGADFEKNHAGISYIVYGGASVSNVYLANLASFQGFSIQGATEGDQSGYAVSGIGDINNDGTNDFIIGAYAANSAAGVSYVIFGNATSTTLMPTHTPSVIPTFIPTFVPTITPTPEPTNKVNLTNFNGFSVIGTSLSYTGYSVSGNCDVNGDGYDDSLIMAPKAGVSYVIYGNSTLVDVDLSFSLPTARGFFITGIINTGTLSDKQISCAGDVNNDGYDDIILGYPSYNSNTGISYVVYGGQNLDDITLTTNITSSQGFYLIGDATNVGMFSGFTVSGAGNINGDEYDDLIVGAPLYTWRSGKNEYYDIGACFIIYGNANPQNVDLGGSFDGITIIGLSGHTRLGYSVSSAGDVNGDGFYDVVIGGAGYPFDGTSSAWKGISYVIYGRNNLVDIYLSEGITTNQGFYMIGANDKDYSGLSVSGAGDVNSDGYSDVIIGAPYYPANNAQGKAYIVYGGNNTSNIENLDNLNISQGFFVLGKNNELVGRSVSEAADINYDGYDDVIIGAPSANSDSGISYVIYGSAQPKNIELDNFRADQGYMIVGENPGDESGTSVSSAGDVNGDGSNDIIIGGPNYPFKDTTGIGYVIFSDAAPTTAPTYLPSYFPTKEPTKNPTNTPTAVPSLVPTNAPTIVPTVSPSNAPIAIPTPIPSNIPTNGDVNNMHEKITIIGKNFDTLGFSVSGIGNINGDEYEDILIGAPGCAALAFTVCKSIDPSGGDVSYVVYGSANLPSVIDLSILDKSMGFTIRGGKGKSNSGYSVSSAGDINADGYDDIIIGEPQDFTVAGKAYVVFGKNSKFPNDIELNNLTLSDGFTIYGFNAGDKTGYSVSRAGNVNKDKYDDIIIGAPGNQTSSSGKSYIIFGNRTDYLHDIQLANLTLSQGLTIYGANKGDRSGWSVSGAGDINKDGYADVIIGAPKAYSYKGVSYVIFGSNTLSDINLNEPINGFSITGKEFYGWSGFSVSNAGDVNNDKCSDVIIGAPYGKAREGISYVVFGCREFANIDLSDSANDRWISIFGIDTFDYSGISVSTAGDVNGDKINDIIIGAPGSSYAGISYVIFGSENIQNIKLEDLSEKIEHDSKGFAIIGADYNDKFGFSVSNAGDIDKDGYSDLVVGAPGGGSQGFHNGLSYIVYGDKMPKEDKSNCNFHDRCWWREPEGSAAIAGIVIVGTAILVCIVGGITYLLHRPFYEWLNHILGIVERDESHHNLEEGEHSIDENSIGMIGTVTNPVNDDTN